MSGQCWMTMTSNNIRLEVKTLTSFMSCHPTILVYKLKYWIHFRCCHPAISTCKNLPLGNVDSRKYPYLQYEWSWWSLINWHYYARDAEKLRWWWPDWEGWHDSLVQSITARCCCFRLDWTSRGNLTTTTIIADQPPTRLTPTTQR